MPDNKETVRQIEAAWSEERLGDLDQWFAPDFVTQSGVPGMPPDLATAKMAHAMSMQAFPDRKTEVQEIIGDGDSIAVRVRMTGTNKGGLPWFNIPANGNAVDVEWITIYSLRDGKVVGAKAVMDLLGLMQQLGAIPTPGAATPI